jgi:predicted transcriptional regulator
MGKRPDGQLEYDVLHVLWTADRPLSPADVNERLGLGLAYTTVATILTRLHAKGLIDRAAVGRAFAYRALVDEVDFALRRIHDILATTTDREQVLARLVARLTDDEADQVRALLDARSA